MQARIHKVLYVEDDTEFVGVEWVGLSEWIHYHLRTGKFANSNVGDVIEFTEEERASLLE